MKPERTLRSRTVFKGRLIEVRVLDVATGPGKVGRREIVLHSGAVAVLATLPDGRLVFVRQFRKPLERVTLEVVAGGIDPGESPAACAHREVREETGYRVRSLQRLGRIYPVPGYSTEYLHVFAALLDPTPGRQDPDPDEHIRVEILTAAQFEALIKAGKMEDAKTLAAWLLYLRRRSKAPRSRAHR